MLNLLVMSREHFELWLQRDRLGYRICGIGFSLARPPHTAQVQIGPQVRPNRTRHDGSTFCTRILRFRVQPLAGASTYPNDGRAGQS
jgi:hypothetical protein